MITTLKAFEILPCDNLAIISTKLLDVISSQINIHIKHQSAWHFLDSKQILQAVPELTEFFQKYKLFPKHAAATIVNEESDLPLHLDAEPVVAKINFPVLNTQGWINTWYTLDEDTWAACPMTKDVFGNAKKDIDWISAEKFIPYASVTDMESPMVFNSQLPHDIKKTSRARVPRVVASFTFFNEPIGMLQ